MFGFFGPQGPLGSRAPQGTPRAPRGVFLPTPVDPTALFLAGAKYVTKNNTFLIFEQFLGQQMVGKKLRLRGWDLSGEIRTEILRISPPWV